MFLALVQQVTDSSEVLVEKNAHIFETIDPLGIGMSVIGYVIVFVALLLLYIVFANLSRILKFNLKRVLRKEGKIEESNAVNNDISGEVNAAIATALHLYFSELHDRENTILTINRVSRTYSPWSSKIYGLRQYPR